MSNARVPVGVRFKEAGKIYYFDAGENMLDVGNYVVVETSHGLEIGRVVIAPDQVLANEIKETLKPIVRIATREDLDQRQKLKDTATDQLREAKHRAAEDGTDMQLVSGEYNLDGSQITFYFTSAKDRIDFRPLARDLADAFGTKVQMLQVGERDRAKMLDGYDVCGQRLCCASWQTSFPSVSIKMAKEQDLPLNPQKISGVCGRLYCCLTFEYEGYRELRGQMPKVGSMVSTPVGEAKVNSVNLMTKTARLWLTDQRQILEMPVVDLQMQYGLTVRPVELVREIEAPLKQQDPAPGEESPTSDHAVTTVEQITPSAAAESAPGESGAKRRRRGRRGGRQRRPGGEDGGGSPPSTSSEQQSGPPGPPPGPPA